MLTMASFGNFLSKTAWTTGIPYRESHKIPFVNHASLSAAYIVDILDFTIQSNSKDSLTRNNKIEKISTLSFEE